jgi:hypothetical protein
MATAAAGISMAATGLSAGAKIFSGISGADSQEASGQATYYSDMFQANNLDLQGTYGDIKASQTDIYMRNQLAGTLANISAVRASSGVGSGSPTESAIENRAENLSDTTRNIRMQNIEQQAEEDRSSASMYRAAGQAALAQSQSNGLGDIFSGLLGGVGSILGAIKL